MERAGNISKEPRGRPKSGRVWKEPGEKKSRLICVKSLHTTWEEKMTKRANRKSMKELESRLKEEARQKKEELRKLREENKKRKEENTRKNEIVQLVTNPKKLKRLSKKQLKSMRKV